MWLYWCCILFSIHPLIGPGQGYMYLCVISKVCWKYRRPTVVFIAIYFTKSLVNKMIINLLFVWMWFVWPNSFHFSCWKGVRIIVFIVPDHVSTRARFRWMEVDRCELVSRGILSRDLSAHGNDNKSHAGDHVTRRRKNRAHGKRALRLRECI